MVKDCTTCANFDIETVYGVCCIHGALGDVVEDCKDYKSRLRTCANDCEIYKRNGFCVGCIRDVKPEMPNFLFKQYDRTYNNFDKCMACFEDLIKICQKQQNYEIAERIKTLLSELDLLKEQTNER